MYPADMRGPLGAFQNSGEPAESKRRIDHETRFGDPVFVRVAGTEGRQSRDGPFDIQSGSYMGYVRVGYSRGARKLSAFANLVDAKAPNLLFIDPSTTRPLQLDFSTQTYDVEAGDAIAVGTQHLLTFGGNARRNNFDIRSRPNARIVANRRVRAGWIFRTAPVRQARAWTIREHQRPPSRPALRRFKPAT